MIVKMTIWPTFMFVRAHMLKQLIAHRTPETTRVPPDTHGADYTAYDSTVAAATYKTACASFDGSALEGLLLL
jgi:hypothetical protein